MGISDLKKRIGKLPPAPGVYQFKDRKGKILYIGKAKDLKKRVRGHFTRAKDQSPKNQKMLIQVADIGWVETNNELEALILEDNLIKEHQPRYNILLRDDKNYQYIRLTIQEEFPRLETVRRIRKDGARYFGPKTSGADLKKTIDFIKKVFKIRTCNYGIEIDPKGSIVPPAKVAVRVSGGDRRPPCLDYHIRRCLGPELGMVTKEEYAGVVERVIAFLNGRHQEGIRLIEEQMRAYAAQRKFELAARLRDQMEAIRRMAEKQIITDTALSDRDVIAYVSEYDKNYFNLFQVRGGRLINQEHFASAGGESAGEIMAAFLRDYYGLAADIPKEVVVSMPPRELFLIQAFISEKAGRKVTVTHPKTGQKDQLVLLAEKNARKYAEQHRARFLEDERRTAGAVRELQKVLGLKVPLDRVEGYDIAHLSGTETVGSMVVFKKGKPLSADYRRFRLKTTQGSMDDYRSMAEVLRRRLNYLPAELPKGYVIRKAEKGDFSFIEKVVQRELLNSQDLDYKTFYLIKKLKKIIGFGRIHKADNEVHVLSTLWIDENERGKKWGYCLMRILIQKSKGQRFYVDTIPGMKEYYLRFGFEEILKPPEAMAKKLDFAKKMAEKATIKKGSRASQFVEAYRKGDILYLAYQKRKKDVSFESAPDLIVVDGGKGQLSAARSVIGDKIPVIALAKREEEVYVPGKSEPIELPKNSMASLLLQRLRDEAHRFANTYNKNLREARMTDSILDTIPGVGPKLKKRLLSHFGSVEGIRGARVEDLIVIAGEGIAVRIKERF